jgi:glycosyltransferase involved in cell wall biosynthesis
MKILTNVHRANSGGGVEMSVLQSTRELARRGHQIHLIYQDGGDLEQEYARFCASMRKVRHSDYYFPKDTPHIVVNRARLVPTALIAAARNPDVYYINRIFAATWGLPAARLNQRPLVCQWHGFVDPGPAHLRSLSARVDGFIATSRFIGGRWAEAGIDPGKIDVVHTGVDPLDYPFGGGAERDQARSQLDIPIDRFVALYFGRLEPEKGVDVLLRAWRRLALPRDRAELVVLGSLVPIPDPDRPPKRLVELTTPSVRFLPSQRDVVTPLHAADVVVVPSLAQEAFGRVVIEALLTGRPVLGSRVGAIPEILTGELSRFLFEPGDDEELASKLASVINWRSREPDLGRRCENRVRERFTLTSMVDGIEQTLERAQASFKARRGGTSTRATR